MRRARLLQEPGAVHVEALEGAQETLELGLREASGLRRERATWGGVGLGGGEPHESLVSGSKPGIQMVGIPEKWKDVKK